MSEHTVALVCPNCKQLQDPVPYGTKQIHCPKCHIRFSVGYIDHEVAELQRQVGALSVGRVDEIRLHELTQTVTRLREVLKRDQFFRPVIVPKRQVYVPVEIVNSLNEADLEFGIVLGVLSLFVGLMLEHYFNKVGSLLLFTTVLVGAFTVYSGRKVYKFKQQLQKEMLSEQHTVSLAPLDPPAPPASE